MNDNGRFTGNAPFHNQEFGVSETDATSFRLGAQSGRHRKRLHLRSGSGILTEIAYSGRSGLFTMWEWVTYA